MVFQIQSLCIFCLGIDAMVVLAWVTAISAKPESIIKNPISRELIQSFAIWCGVALILPPFLFRLTTGPSLPRDQIESYAQSVLQSPPLSIQNGNPRLSFGPEDAKITIVEFSDFQCPFCRRGALLLHVLRNKFPEKIRVVLKHFPLDSQCNRTGGGHPFSCEAARVNFCSAQQKLFPQVYETIFENQESIRSGKPREWAIAAGARADELDQCLNSDLSRTAIEADIEEGIRLNIKSTPTFFVNGRRVEGALPLPVWERIIESL
jgi:protein-disulfide isomerase